MDAIGTDVRSRSMVEIITWTAAMTCRVVVLPGAIKVSATTSTTKGSTVVATAPRIADHDSGSARCAGPLVHKVVAVAMIHSNAIKTANRRSQRWQTTRRSWAI